MTRTQVATSTAQVYTIDKAHSEVTFQVRHLLTKVRGRFSDFAGTVRLDEGEPGQSSVSLRIDANRMRHGVHAFSPGVQYLAVPIHNNYRI